MMHCFHHVTEFVFEWISWKISRAPKFTCTGKQVPFLLCCCSFLWITVKSIQQVLYNSDLDFLSLHFLSISKPPLILTLNLIQWHSYNIKNKRKRKRKCIWSLSSSYSSSSFTSSHFRSKKKHLRICLLFLNIQNYSRTKTTTPILWCWIEPLSPINDHKSELIIIQFLFWSQKSSQIFVDLKSELTTTYRFWSLKPLQIFVDLNSELISFFINWSQKWSQLIKPHEISRHYLLLQLWLSSLNEEE